MLLGEFDPYFVCDDCAENNHENCMIKQEDITTWCDCQHKPRKKN